MSRFCVLIVSCFLVLMSPASAQSPEQDGPSLLEQGMQMFMEGLLKEMEPALDELEQLGPLMRDFVQQMGPALTELMDEVKDWSAYHPPEILPNGDIIIRRRTPEEPSPDITPGDQIDI